MSLTPFTCEASPASIIYTSESGTQSNLKILIKEQRNIAWNILEEVFKTYWYFIKN